MGPIGNARKCQPIRVFIPWMARIGIFARNYFRGSLGGSHDCHFAKLQFVETCVVAGVYLNGSIFCSVWKCATFGPRKCFGGFLGRLEKSIFQHVDKNPNSRFRVLVAVDFPACWPPAKNQLLETPAAKIRPIASTWFVSLLTTKAPQSDPVTPGGFQKNGAGEGMSPCLPFVLTEAKDHEAASRRASK